MSNPQLEALGNLMPVLDAYQEFVIKTRRKYKVYEFGDIKNVPLKICAAVRADCYEYAESLTLSFKEIKAFKKIFNIITRLVGKAKMKEVAKESTFLSVVGDKIYIEYEVELAKNLAHFILTDKPLPLPKSMTRGMLKVPIFGDTFIFSMVGSLTDIDDFTIELKEEFRKTYKQPKFGAENYVRNSRYFSWFKIGLTDEEIAEREVDPLVEKEEMDTWSDEYFELIKKEKDRIRSARRQFERQLKAMVDV